MERLKKKQLALQYKSEQKKTKLGRMWLTKSVLVKLSIERHTHKHVSPFPFSCCVACYFKNIKIAIS